MVFREIIAFLSENHMKPQEKELCDQNSDLLNAKAGGNF
jgi:hypothetical protein